MEYKEGIYLINKPRGRSSFSIVAQVRRLSGIKKVGHAGTLDPEAEGLLIVLVGKDFTRQAEKYSKLDKTYQSSSNLVKILVLMMKKVRKSWYRIVSRLWSN